MRDPRAEAALEAQRKVEERFRYHVEVIDDDNSEEHGIPRSTARWGNEAETDLQNTLSGWSPRNSQRPQRTDGLSTLRAIPLKNEDIKHTAVGRLFNENMQAIRADVWRTVPDRATQQRIHDANLDDTEGLVELYQELRAASSANVAEKQFEGVLRYLTLKHRLAFETEHLIQIEATDSPAQIQQKTAEKNAAFKRETDQLKQNIIEAIDAAGIAGPRSTAHQRIVSHTLNSMALYTNNVFKAAAQYESAYKSQKEQLIGFASTTVEHLQRVQDLAPQNARLQAQKEQAEAQLTPIYEKPATPEAKAALRWAIAHEHLQTRYQHNPTNDNKEDIRFHEAERPADYDEHLNTRDPNKSIAVQLREAAPHIRQMAAAEAQQQQLEDTQPTIEKAKRDIAHEAHHQELLDELDEAVHQYAEGRRLDVNEQRKYVAFLLLERIAEEIPTPENEQDLQDFVRENNLVYGLQTQFPNDAIDELIDDIVQDERRYEAAEQPHQAMRGQPEYNLVRANIEYEQQLQSIAALVQANDNPTPEFIAQMQQTAQGANIIYNKTVKEIHEKAGSTVLLEQVSRPLNALRDNAVGFVASLPMVGMLGDHRQEQTRLPVLDINKYQLDGEKLPPVLTEIARLTQEVNQLLEKREAMEAQLSTHPKMAKALENDISENTIALDRKMGELAERARVAHRHGFLSTHPDIATWSRKAAALHAATNRLAFFESQNSTFTTKLHDGLLGVLARSFSEKNSKQPLMSEVKYSTKVVDDLRRDVATTYLVQLKPFVWAVKEHKTMIKQRDGSTQMENIIFTAKEHGELFDEFCQKYRLDGPEAPKCERNGDIITIDWHKKETREEWLKFMVERYKEKRAKENDMPEAEVDIDAAHHDGGVVHAAVPR